MAARGMKSWAIEVQFTPIGDQRRRIWTRSKTMSYTDARKAAHEYEALGIPYRLVEVESCAASAS